MEGGTEYSSDGAARNGLQLMGASERWGLTWGGAARG